MPDRSAAVNELTRPVPNASTLLATEFSYIPAGRVPNFKASEESGAAENVRVHNLGQAIISPSGVVFVEGIAIDETHSLRNFSAQECEEMKVVPLKGTVSLPNTLLVNSPAPRNYYHFLFDYCARALFSRSVNFFRRHVHLSINLLSYQQRVLSDLDIRCEEYFFSNSQWISVENLLLIEQRNFGTYFSPQVLEAMRSFRDIHVRGSSTSPRKIYLSRKAQGHRRIENESDLETLARDNGFSVIAPETLSFREQAQLFANAEVIIGASGAAFSNLAFCGAQARVFELRPPIPGSSSAALFWQNFCASCGLNHQALEMIPVVQQEAKSHNSRTFAVNLDYVNNLLREFT